MEEVYILIDDLICFINVEIEYAEICLKHNSEPSKQPLQKKKIIKKLEWTGDKINLVELIYALYYAKCINNGNIKIKNIIEAFQETFNIDLGEYYRAFVEIKRRKLVRGKFMRTLLNLIEDKILSSDN